MDQINSHIINNIDSNEEKSNDINNEQMPIKNSLKEPLLSEKSIHLEINLNNTDFNKPLEKIEELYDECPICFDLLDKTQEVCTLECKHKFHLECLIDWYRRPNSNYKCPTCCVHREIISIENTKKFIPSENNNKKIYKENKKNCVIC